MRSLKKHIIKYLLLCLVLTINCQDKAAEEVIVDDLSDNDTTYKLPNIDLNHWKVTLPIGNPTEVKPPAILDYATNATLKPFMYNDSIKGALIFYTYPAASTANSSYSRTELREQMVPGSNNTNWTFSQGGYLKGELAMGEITKDLDNDYYRIIIMQIHGRLTNAQKNLIGQSDNNAPPVLKIYWVDGKVRVKTKVLRDLNATDIEILETSAWGDDDGYTFPEYVGFDKFTLEVKVSEGRMEVIMNGNSKVYDDIHMQKWSIFENYFKAGNYLVTRDSWAKSKIEYYKLEVSH
jgi:hypothetical protein